MIYDYDFMKKDILESRKRKIEELQKKVEEDAVLEAWGNAMDKYQKIRDIQEYHTVMLLDIYERLTKVENYLKRLLNEKEKVTNI